MAPATLDERPSRPLRAGLMQLDPPALLGSRCTDCGTLVFPAKDFCPRCHSDNAQAVTALSRQGCVFTYTVVHQAPAGRPTPYVLAYVDLDDGVRVMAQLRVAIDQVRIGLPVRLVIEQVFEDLLGPVIGYVFEACDAPRDTGEAR